MSSTISKTSLGHTIKAEINSNNRIKYLRVYAYQNLMRSRTSALYKENKMNGASIKHIPNNKN